MAAEVINNIYLVNAPAGSGKTTTIRRMIEEHLLENPNDNILCITYTNRAAEELGKNIESKNIFFGTIHSYINSFLKSYFSHKEIIDLYWEEYGEAIEKRIENHEQDQHIAESNQRYINKYGGLSVEIVRENMNKISYTEAPFNSLYSGGLGHDALITFTRKVVERFPVVRKKISNKFQLVFIDEYQDTNADVLKIFFYAMYKSSGVLYLLGDKMQQIYDNYDGSFEKEFSMMNRSINLFINYRATPKLVSILNNIYNDESYIQIPFERNTDEIMSHDPEVIFSSNVDGVIRKKQESDNDILVLYLLNNRKFGDIGAANLYKAVNKIDDYKFGGKYGAVEVLTTNDETNPDRLFVILFLLGSVAELYQLKKFGMLLRFIKKNHKWFNTIKCSISHHEDKEKVKTVLENVVCYYKDEGIIRNALENIKTLDFLNEERLDAVLQDPIYDEVLNVSMDEFRSLYEYLHTKNISTQHGVKGESHESVLFVADDSNNPSVSMTEFFKVWSNHDIKLKQLEEFSYSYSEVLRSIEEIAGPIINNEIYIQNKIQLEAVINNFASTNADNELFNCLCKNDWDAYSAKSNLTNFKKIFKKTRIKSVLMAYRLFYVGCSRARKNLTILIDTNRVNSFIADIIEKFKMIGFNVIEDRNKSVE